MRRLTGILTALGITLYFIAAGSLTAHAATTTIEFTAEDFYIPRPATASDQVGVERRLATVETPAELVGATCSVVGTSTNGESVNLNNYGMIRSNGDSVRIDGTEDTASGVRLSDRTIVLGVTIDLYNVMQPDANGIVATSVNYSVRVTCTIEDDTIEDDTTTTSTTIDDSTTTTTPPPTTLTTDSSTTSTSITIPATTTTAPTGSTTSTQPPSTSTIPPGSSTSTTAPTDSTSTSLIEQDTSTTTHPTTDETLPWTGPPVEAAGMVMAGLALLALGGAVLVAGRDNG
jgi:hypothetical protein